MISRKILTEVLEKALSSGADFAEIYVEHTKQNNISMVDSRVDAITDRLICGVGIRILKGTRCVSGSTSSLERNDLLALAARIAQALSETTQNRSVKLTEHLFGDIHPIRLVPESVENRTKIDLLKDLEKETRIY